MPLSLSVCICSSETRRKKQQERQLVPPRPPPRAPAGRAGGAVSGLVRTRRNITRPRRSVNREETLH